MKTFSITKKLTSAFVALALTLGTGIILTACGDQNSGTTEPEAKAPIVYKFGKSPSVLSYPVTDPTDSTILYFRVVLSSSTFADDFSASDIVISTNYGDFQVTKVEITDPTDTVEGEIIEPNTQAAVTAKPPVGLPDQYTYTLKISSNVKDIAGNLADPSQMQYYGSDLRKSVFYEIDSNDRVSVISKAIESLTAKVQSSNIEEKPIFAREFVDNLATMVYFIQDDTAKSNTESVAQKSFDQFVETMKNDGYVISGGFARPESAQVVASEAFSNFALPTDTERASIKEAAKGECSVAKTGSYDLFCGDLANLKTASASSSFTDIVRALAIISNDYQASLYMTARIVKD
jgi:hypothetical protein